MAVSFLKGVTSHEIDKYFSLFYIRRPFSERGTYLCRVYYRTECICIS